MDKKELPKVGNVCGTYLKSIDGGIAVYTAKCKECGEPMLEYWDRCMDDMCNVCQMYLYDK